MSLFRVGAIVAIGAALLGATTLVLPELETLGSGLTGALEVTGGELLPVVSLFTLTALRLTVLRLNRSVELAGLTVLGL